MKGTDVMKAPGATSCPPCHGITRALTVALCLLIQVFGEVAAQDYEHDESIEEAAIYDHNPSTELGDDVFGTVVADFSEPVNG